MSVEQMTWEEVVDHGRERGLFAKTLYLVITQPTGQFADVFANAEDHLAYQAKLEREGVMVLAGPLGPVGAERTDAWDGVGMFLYRASSLAEATAIAEADPMHSSGARSFTVRKWLLNEGRFELRVSLASGSFELS